MQIDLSQNDQKKLAALATASGFETVELFVTNHLKVLANESLVDNSALKESLEMCDRGMAEIDATGGIDAHEAIREMGQKRNFSFEG